MIDYSDGTVDFLVFAPLSEEVEALKEAFGIQAALPEILDDGSSCYRHTIELPERQVVLLIVQLRHMGVLGAAVMATKLIPSRKPWSIISFGIAGGFVGEDINIQDVFVPDVVLYYEPAKETVGSTGSKRRTGGARPQVKCIRSSLQ
jgi:nucleoside phosphorylase